MTQLSKAEQNMSDSLKLPIDLHEQIERLANARGISVQDFVLQSLEEVLAASRESDSLFADNEVYDSDGPSDTAANHDDYLYGDAS